MGQQQQGLAKVAPEGSPEAAMAMFWRSAADMLRAQNAAVGENQLHVREMFGAFLENVPLVQASLRGEIERLQTENASLRTKVMEGFTAVQDSMDRSNQRDLEVLIATRREQNFADVMGMLRELTPRLFEQFVGIREVKKQIGKLDQKTLDQVLAVVSDAKAKDLLQKIYDEEQARVHRLKDLVGGKKSAPVSSTDSSEEREGAA
jgi:type III secretory pathway component EscV